MPLAICQVNFLQYQCRIGSTCALINLKPLKYKDVCSNENSEAVWDRCHQFQLIQWLLLCGPPVVPFHFSTHLRKSYLDVH